MLIETFDVVPIGCCCLHLSPLNPFLTGTPEHPLRRLHSVEKKSKNGPVDYFGFNLFKHFVDFFSKSATSRTYFHTVGYHHYPSWPCFLQKTFLHHVNSIRTPRRSDNTCSSLHGWLLCICTRKRP